MLVVCPGCRRHVRAEEAHCPFCDHAVSPSPRSAPLGRRSRSAIAALGFGLSACAAGSKPNASPASTTAPTTAPTTSAVAPGDAGPDGRAEVGDATVASLDAASEDADDPIATGVLYGLPPPTGLGGVIDTGVDPEPKSPVRVSISALKGAEPGDDAAVAKQRPFFRVCYLQHAAVQTGYGCPFSVSVGPAGTTARVVCAPLVPPKLTHCLEHRLEIAPWAKAPHQLSGKLVFEVP